MSNSRSLKTVFIILLALFWMPWQGVNAAVVAGKVVYARGACAALVEGADNAPRLLGADTEIYEGDIVQTGSDSFVVVEFVDKARITIRPNTSFRVQKYAAEGNQEAKMQLEKGGVNAEVGQIAKNNPGKFQVETPDASIKSNGANFVAHLCDKDCEAKPSGGAAKPDNSIARVVQAKGGVEAIDKGGVARPLAVGSPVFEQEKLRSQADAYAVLVFRDGSRATVAPASEMEISAYRYQPSDSANNTQILKLITGGVRALTGAIGKEKKENFKLATPVATIGIRGTEFDVALGANESNLSFAERSYAALDPWLQLSMGETAGGVYDFGNKIVLAEGDSGGNGLFVHVNSGGVGLNLANSQFPVNAGQTFFIANQFSTPIAVPGIPSNLINDNIAPQPSTVPVKDEKGLFSGAPGGGGGKAGGGGGKGTVVSVKGGGSVGVDSKGGGSATLKDGDTTLTSGGKTETLGSPPSFMTDDPFAGGGPAGTIDGGLPGFPSGFDECK